MSNEGQNVVLDEQKLREIIREEISNVLINNPTTVCQSEWFTPKEAAAFAKVTEGTLRNWRKEGLKCDAVGRVIRYSRSELTKFISKEQPVADIFEKINKRK